jgi:predicted RNA-binding protein
VAAVVYMDNPAGRLYRILDRMKHARGNVPVMNGMAEVLEIDPPFLPDVARAVAEVFSLAVETEREVQSLGDDQPKELLLQWHPRVMEALNAMFFQRRNPPLTLDVVAALYSAEDLLALAFCSATLHSARRELVIEFDALARVREQIVDLLDVLESDADLDGELRRLLLRNGRVMLWACDSYHWRGAAGIRDAVNQTVGALVNNPDLVARAESSPKSWQKAMTVVAMVTSLVNLGNTVVTAIEKAGAGQPAQIVIVSPRELPPGTGSADPPSPHTHGTEGSG